MPIQTLEPKKVICSCKKYCIILPYDNYKVKNDPAFHDYSKYAMDEKQLYLAFLTYKWWYGTR